MTQKLNHPDISIVVPVFNEASVLIQTLARLGGILERMGDEYEIVLVDDGSSDGTQEVIGDAATLDRRIVPVILSRNFGKEAALAAGLETARGKCIVFLDDDLQHPPELIVALVGKWKAGYDVVNARKKARGSESFLYRWFSKVFNWGMSTALGSDFAGASDYKLIDRQVANALMQCPERSRFFRGLVSWVGFRVAHLDFEVADRDGGESKWGPIDLVRYSISNLVGFSSLPLQMVAYIGFFTSGVGLILLVHTLFNYFTGRAVAGFTTVIAVQILLGGMILLALGTVAIYIGKIYTEQKARPLFIIRQASERDALRE